MNPVHRPTFIPAIEMVILLLDALEAPSFQSRFLRVANLRFNLAFQIGCVRAAGQSENAVMFEHLRVKRVEFGIIDVRLDHAFFEIIQANGVGRAAELRERLFMQFAPDLRRRVPNNPAKRAAAVAELHHE